MLLLIMIPLMIIVIQTIQLTWTSQGWRQGQEEGRGQGRRERRRMDRPARAAAVPSVTARSNSSVEHNDTNLHKCIWDRGERKREERKRGKRKTGERMREKEGERGAKGLRSQGGEGESIRRGEKEGGEGSAVGRDAPESLAAGPLCRRAPTFPVSSSPRTSVSQSVFPHPLSPCLGLKPAVPDSLLSQPTTPQDPPIP